MAIAMTVWVYWACVVAMIVRVRRHTRRLSGIVPSQRLERVMGLVWVPLVAAWLSLPWLAASATAAPWGLPGLAQLPPWAALRWVAVGLGVLCLALSVECWLRMGKDWRMAVTPERQTNLVTTGLFAYVRHPIYALSMLLMLCTLGVVPTAPVALMAVIHIGLMITKARNEERFLAQQHGAPYARYLRRTGRFMPRLRAAPESDPAP